KLGALSRMGRREGGAVRTKDQAFEQSWRLRPGIAGATAWTLLKDGMHLVPKSAGDDRLVLARIAFALVHRLADIDPVVEQLVEEPLVDQLAAAGPHILGSKGFRQHSGRAD